MFERADAFVALPGGIGTLEELIEQNDVGAPDTWYQKLIVLLNIDDFWTPLIELLQHMKSLGFIHSAAKVSICCGR